MPEPSKIQSDTPDAIRQREYRAKQRAKLAELQERAERSAANVHATPATATNAAEAPSTGSTPASRVPMHETRVVDASGGPERFAAAPFLPPSNDNANAKDETYVPPTPEPEKPPLTREDVKPIAMAVAKYFEVGSMLALMRHAEELAAAGIDPRAVAEQMPTLKAFVQTSAENVCMKYRIKFPYQDEAVCAGAIGIATFGFVGGKKKTAQQQQAPAPTSGVVGNAPVEARNANASANAPTSGPPAAPFAGAGEPEDAS